MRLFRSEEAVERWCASEGRPVGAILSLTQLGRLARAWYGDRLDPDWRPRSVADSQRILDTVGLTGDFWALA
ncbi:MAG: hypothetical protein QOK25_1444 [Thermoleophilaceae bacterium]|jgi:hypothetical protein|nr:hypothetical protein [Thermoleophilaceae bacterium]